MGHRVSTPRNCSHNGPARGNASTVATSLAILLALTSATASSSSSSLGFVSHQRPQRSHWLLSEATSSTSLHAASSTAIAAAAALVPPPNSRLGRLRQQSQSTSSLPTLQRLGTKNNDIRRASGSDLRYATYGSHEEGLEGASSDDGCTVSEPSSSWRNCFLSKRADTMEEQQQETDSEGSFNRAQQDDAVNAITAPVVKKQRGRKRARMLRFLDKRLARQQLKFDQDDSYSSSSPTTNNSSDTNNRRRLDYEERKAAWAAKYTSVSYLRQSFGKNKNRLWGDFDPTTTRKLYHTLLPRALLELRGLRDGLLLNASDVVEVEGDVEEKKMKLKKKNEQKRINRPSNNDDDDNSSAVISNILDNDPDYLQQELKELAPLAYQARLAAKKYARERSRVPGRIGSMLYDGYRSWRRYGKWKSSGMTWEQVWNKYEEQVMGEATREAQILLLEGTDDVLCLADDDENCVPSSMVDVDEEELDDEELTARICLRILERSVITNDAIDKLFIKRLAEDDTTTGDHVGESSSSSRATMATADNNDDNVIQESKKRRQQRKHRIRKRKSRIQADLRSIEKKFDDDIRELLKYSTLTTREGEERRRKKSRGGAFSRGGAGDAVGGGNITATGTSAPAAAASTVTANDTPSELSLEIDDSIEISSKEDQEAPVITATASVGDAATATADNEDDDDAKLRKLAVHEVFALRILAKTKQRITSLQALPQLGGGGGTRSDTDTEQAATAAVKDKNDQ